MPARTPAVPLKSYEDQAAFKVFMNDIGLLGALSELDPPAYHDSELFVEFKGAMTEQFVLQELIAERSFSMYYYSSEKSRYEVDFLYQKDGGIVPLEVKARLVGQCPTLGSQFTWKIVTKHIQIMIKKWYNTIRFKETLIPE